MLARICNVAPDSIRRLARAADPTLLRAGARTLGDRRLLFPDPKPRRNDTMPIPGSDVGSPRR